MINKYSSETMIKLAPATRYIVVLGLRMPTKYPNFVSKYLKAALQRYSYKRFSENMQQIYRRTPWRSATSIKLQSNFIEVTLRHGFSFANLLHMFRTPFLKNTSGRLLLSI